MGKVEFSFTFMSMFWKQASGGALTDGGFWEIMILRFLSRAVEGLAL
jgi:hypothetical protein